MEAASSLMSTLHDAGHGLDPSLMSCIDAIAADCLTYRAPSSWAEHDLAEFFSVLKRAEAHSYHCCPPEVLQIMLSASRLANADAVNTSGHSHVDDAI
jgi:hypothetical protein